jgi:STE24 endopeptidase
MANLPVDFTPADVERARRYRRPLYAAFGVDILLRLTVLGVLAFSPLGAELFGVVEGFPWWGQTLAFAGLVIGIVALLCLPLGFWRGYLRERRFGFSTQRARGWAGDRAKGFAVEIVLGASALLVLVGCARALPAMWPAVAAPAAALLVVVLGLVAPVVLEPLFNRFSPLEDAALAAELRSLSERAGVPVETVLVADASRRTTKANAYVSGIGRTRRVVLYDTLLRQSGAPEIRLVTAHELAHRRERHVAKGTALGAVGAAIFVLVLWGLLLEPNVLAALGVSGPGDPRVVPFVLLVGTALELLAAPFGAALSRRWERAADRGSLELTGDLAAFEAAHLELARSNLSDLDPPRAVYLALFSHPTPPERLAAAREWGVSSATERPGA